MATLIDSYSESNQSNEINVHFGSVIGIGESFTSDSGVLNSATFYISKEGSPTGNATYNLYDHTGTFGSTGTPTGAALATSENIDVSSLTTSLALVTANFTGLNKYSLVSSTNYFITVEYSGGDASNHINIGVDLSSPTHAGNGARTVSGWGAQTYDVCFYVYKDDPVTPLKITGLQSVTGLQSLITG